jgi:hypothetical protein
MHLFVLLFPLTQSLKQLKPCKLDSILVASIINVLGDGNFVFSLSSVAPTGLYGVYNVSETAYVTDGVI